MIAEIKIYIPDNLLHIKKKISCQMENFIVTLFFNNKILSYQNY